MREALSAWIGLGANLGDARQQIQKALSDLGQLPDTRVLAHSSLYRSAPHEAQGPDFINAVAWLETRLSAPDLLAQLQRLESLAGRERPYLNAPRTLDLDLLVYGEARMQSPRLTLPHPRLQERAFVLLPWQEIAPDAIDAQVLARWMEGQDIERIVDSAPMRPQA